MQVCRLLADGDGCVRAGMRAVVIPHEEQQINQAFVVRDKAAVIDHGENFIPVRPFCRLYFLRLKMQFGQFNVLLDQVDIVKSTDGDEKRPNFCEFRRLIPFGWFIFPRRRRIRRSSDRLRPASWHRGSRR